MKPFFSLFLLLVLITANSCTKEFDGKNGLKTIYYPETEIVNQTIEYENGKKNGVLKEFYRNGNLKILQHFKDDKPVDSALWYHPNGKIAEIQIHVNGNKEGCWKKFNKTGGMYSEICFKNNLLEGQSIVYSYKSLRPIERFNFSEGKKHGKQEEFYSNGKPKSICYYNYGRTCEGTEEWTEGGRKIENDFEFKISEQNKVQLKNTLTFYISLTNPHPEDEIYQIGSKDSGCDLNPFLPLKKENDRFILEYTVYKGSFVMEKVKLAAYRKTGMGNKLIKTTVLTASANNF